MTELEHLSFFYVQTKKRILEIEYKKSQKTMTRAEMFELDACRGDKKRAERELAKHKKELEKK